MPKCRSQKSSRLHLAATLALVVVVFLVACIPLTFIPGRGIHTAVGGIARTLIGHVNGRPLWTSSFPNVDWESVEVGPPPTNPFPPYVWLPNASRAVLLPDGRNVKLKLASARSPLAYTIEGLLDREETAELRRASVRALGAHESTTRDAFHPRIAPLPANDNPIVDLLNRRTAALLRVPESLFARSNLSTTWYGAGGQYLGHHDAVEVERHERECREKGRHPTAGGPRFATVMWYLSDVPDASGGETMFPFQGVDGKPPQEQLDRADPCNSIWGKLTVPSRAATGVLWYNYLPADTPSGIGDLDWGAFHRGCDVLSGSKLIAVRWVPLPLPAECRAEPVRPAISI